MRVRDEDILLLLLLLLLLISPPPPQPPSSSFSSPELIITALPPVHFIKMSRIVLCHPADRGREAGDPQIEVETTRVFLVQIHKIAQEPEEEEEGERRSFS